MASSLLSDPAMQALPRLASLLSASTSLALTAFALAACTDPQPDDAGAPVLTAPARVDLGAGDCGGAATGTFVIANDGDAPLAYTIDSVDPRVVTVPAGGTIPAGETQLVEVQADVPEAAAAGEAITAALLARPTGGPARMIEVAFAARGAMFAIAPATIGIGDQPIGQRASRDVTIRNIGNAAAVIAIASPGGEFGGGLAPTVMGADAEHTTHLTYLPRDLGADLARAAITFDGAVCGARPAAIELSGQGVAGQGILIQGGPVEFGTVTCDGQEVERTLTLVNPTDLPATFTAQMWDTDLDDVNFEVRPAQGAIAARGSVQVSVRRRDAHGPSGPREIDSAVRIVTTLAGHQDVRDVAVHEILSSAELRIVGDTDFGWLPANTVASAPVEITNVGNAPARITVAAPGALTAVVPQWLDPGATGIGWVTYRQAAPAPYTGVLAVSAIGSCQRPVERTYTAGRGAYASVAPVEAFGACGTVPTSARLHVSNPGTAPLEIRCRPAGASPLALGFAQASLSVAAGGRAAFDLTMAAGDGAPGTVVAEVMCVANDGPAGGWQQQSTTVTRTVLPADQGCDALPL